MAQAKNKSWLVNTSLPSQNDGMDRWFTILLPAHLTQEQALAALQTLNSSDYGYDADMEVHINIEEYKAKAYRLHRFDFNV